MQALNQSAVNQWYLDPSLLSITQWLTLWGFGLCEHGGVTIQYNDVNYSNKFYDNQYLDWQRLISHLVKEKNIIVDFVIKGETKEELQALVDQFKVALSGQKTWWSVLLTVNVWDETRVLKVVCQWTQFNNDWINTTTQSWRTTIVAVDPPRFYSYVVSTKYYKDITWTLNGQINNLWNAITYPVYYIIFSEATGVDHIELTINGYKVTIDQTITAWDLLVVSADIYWIIKDAGVYINDVGIDFNGQVTTEITSGTNNILFECNGTYNADISIIYHNMRE
jgi:hypothetical protein